MKNTKAYRIDPDSKVSLSDYDPDDTGTMTPQHAQRLLKEQQQRLFELQELLYAESKHALLVVLQAMDAGGKDGTIRHIFTGVNPQGCFVTSFKVPTDDERRHDFLWRVHRVVPAHGMIAVFNRSHYEDVLVVRVHGEIHKHEVKRRFEQINAFERMLFENGTTVLKFFLHVSREEQRKRLEERLTHPNKYWKVSVSDVKERQYWDDYQRAYEDVFEACSTKHAPWYVIPANKKWFRNALISHILVAALEEMDLKYPKPSVDVAKMKLV